MHFEEYKIPDGFNSYMLSIYCFTCIDPEKNKFYIPDGNLDLMISNHPLEVYSKTKKILHQEKGIFWGQIRFTGTLESAVPYRVFGIKFQPWLFALFKKNKQLDLVDTVFPLKYVFSERLISTLDHFFRDWQFENPDLNKIERLSFCLKAELPKDVLIKPHFKKIMLALKRRNGVYSVADLIKIYEQSARTLEYDFKKYIGIKAKEYQNIVRFRKSCMHIKETKNIVHTAIDYGYYDQSHYTNHFTKTCSKSPSLFLIEGNLVLSSA